MPTDLEFSVYPLSIHVRFTKFHRVHQWNIFHLKIWTQLGQNSYYFARTLAFWTITTTDWKKIDKMCQLIWKLQAFCFILILFFVEIEILYNGTFFSWNSVLFEIYTVGFNFLFTWWWINKYKIYCSYCCIFHNYVLYSIQELYWRNQNKSIVC